MAVALAAAFALADDAPTLRYGTAHSRLTLEVDHAIEIRADQVIEAGRSLSFDLTLGPDPAGSRVVVTVDRARGTSRAHGMDQRLGASHLRGKSIPLAITDDGRRVEPVEGEGPPGIDIGPMVTGRVTVEAIVADLLPVLPEGPVTPGATWSSQRTMRTLEGWAWAWGAMQERHRVVSVERSEGRTVVQVESEATAKLGPVEGGRDYEGDLVRTARWSFDADAGRLISLSIDQKTTGVSDLGGRKPIVQLTRIVIGPPEASDP